jgi:hypothetical protein
MTEEEEEEEEKKNKKKNMKQEFGWRHQAARKDILACN